MTFTIPYDVDTAEFAVDVAHNPDTLRVKVDGVTVEHDYSSSTIFLHNLKQGQVVEVGEQPMKSIEGEAPIVATAYPYVTQMKFRINSLDYLPIDREDES